MPLHQRRESTPTLRLPQVQLGCGNPDRGRPIAAVCTMFVPIAAASSIMIVMIAVGIRKCGENQGGGDQSAALKNAIV